MDKLEKLANLVKCCYRKNPRLTKRVSGCILSAVGIGLGIGGMLIATDDTNDVKNDEEEEE